jgi:hypothetical protein
MGLFDRVGAETAEQIEAFTGHGAAAWGWVRAISNTPTRNGTGACSRRPTIAL